MMNMSPIRQGLWTLLAALLLAVPMYLLTRLTTVPVPVASTDLPAGQERQNNVECLLTIRCASLPERLVIRQGKQVLFDLAKHVSSALRMEEFVSLPISPKRPVKLSVTAQWRQGQNSTPITLTLEPDMMKNRSETKWSNGTTLNDTYSFLW